MQANREQAQEQESATVYGPALGMRFREAVRAYAWAHYNEGGWDFIAEGFPNGEMAELIGTAETQEEAIVLARARATELNRARRARVFG